MRSLAVAERSSPGAAPPQGALQANVGPGRPWLSWDRLWGRTGDVGHVFNGVNQGGTIRFLDGQTGGAA